MFDRVNFPAKDEFLRAPGGVAFVELLEGDWFLPCSFGIGISTEDFSSIARKGCRVISLLSFGPPWNIMMESSIYTLTWAGDVARACRYRASQLLSASSLTATSSDEVCGGLVSAKSSRWYGGAVWRVERVSSVRSLTVSVVSQNKATDYTYPMVIER